MSLLSLRIQYDVREVDSCPILLALQVFNEKFIDQLRSKLMVTHYKNLYFVLNCSFITEELVWLAMD